MTEPSTSGSGAVEPELCRVSVIGGDTQLDLGLPATVPIAAFITDVVELIESRNPDLTEHDEGAPLRTEHWTLARIGRDPISPNQTLTEAEVFDGELLVLRSVTAKEVPALFDDVIDAVAKLTSASFRGWSPVSARWMGLITGVGAILAAIALLFIAKADGSTAATGLLPLGVGIGSVVAAVIAVRKYQAELVAIALGSFGLVLFFASATLLVPGAPGSPHLMLGSAMVLVLAVVAYSVTGVGATVFAAAITVSIFGGTAAFARMIGSFDADAIGAGALIVVLIVIGAAPRLAVAAARLPVPPVPTAGAAIDPADHEPRPTVEDIGVIGATALPSAAGLEIRATAANRYQSGTIIGVTVAAIVASFFAADPFGATRWQGIALAAIISVILCLRGRAYADLIQASTLIGGGAVTMIAVSTGVALGHPTWLVPMAAVLLGLAAAMVGFGVVAPHIEISPVTRRAGEIFEYLLIVVVVPLVLWIMDVYSAARSL